MYVVIKIFNNSALIAADKKGNKVLLRGSGIGFNQKAGAEILVSDDTQVAYLTDDEKAKQILMNVPSAILDITDLIFELAVRELGRTLSQALIWLLADHLNYAIERTKSNLQIENSLQYEVPYLYFKEYEIAKKALQLINEKLEVELPASEASFIALHLVNAQLENGEISDLLLVTEISKKVITIIQSIFQISLDKTTSNYSRFIVHLHYFIARQKNIPKNDLTDALGLSFSDVMREKYAANYACALMIQDMLLRDYNWAIESSEILYLVIHMERLLQENKIK